MWFYCADTEIHKAENNALQKTYRRVVGLLPELKLQMQEVASLDAALSEDGSLTLANAIQADHSLENETIDKISEHSKNELWGIVERFTTEKGVN